MEKIEGQFFAHEKSCPLNPSPFLNAHQLGTTLMPGQLKISELFSYTHLLKLNDDVLNIWAEIHKKPPDF